MNVRSLLVLLLCHWALPVLATPGVVELTPQQRETMAIELYAVGEQAGELSGPLPGRLVLSDRHQRALTLPVSGTIEQLDVLQGARVAAGDTLGTYHSREALALQRDYLGAVDRLERSSASKQRDQALHEGGVISSKRWQQTLAEYRQRDAMVAELASQLAALGFAATDLQRLRESRSIRDRLPLRAPIDGAVLERHVAPGDAFVPGQELFHLGDVTQLWVAIQASPEIALAARQGDAVYAGQTRLGSLLQVGAAVEEASQAVDLTAEVDALPAGMMPGQSLLVRLQAGGRRGLWLPRDSLVSLAGETVVFVASGDHFEVREVEVAPGPEGWVVLAGLAEGEAVVAVGAALLKGAAQGMGGVAEHDH